MNKITIDFAANLNHLCESKGLNAADIANAIDVAHSVVRRWMKGEVLPSAKNLLNIVQLLDIDASQLFGCGISENRTNRKMTTTELLESLADSMGYSLTKNK